MCGPDKQNHTHRHHHQYMVWYRRSGQKQVISQDYVISFSTLTLQQKTPGNKTLLRLSLIPLGIWLLIIFTSHLFCIRLLQFKLTHCFFFKRENFFKMYLNSDASRPRCHHSPVTMGHMFWLCMFSYMCYKTKRPKPFNPYFVQFLLTSLVELGKMNK